MPRVTDQEITGYAHCPDPRCDGYRQEQVPAIRQVVEHTYADSGGDMPGVEKSQVYIRFVDDSQSLCGCGREREVTDQQRIVYQPLSGHAQDGLLAFKPAEAR
jgi:hypothetical protein